MTDVSAHLGNRGCFGLLRSEHGAAISGNALSIRATPSGRSGVQDCETSEAVRVRDSLSDWPLSARRCFRYGRHLA